MNLFFAYVLAVCPALNDMIMILFWASFVAFCAGVIAYIHADINDNEEMKKTASIVFAYFGKAAIILLLLSCLIPSQKQLNTIMLNHHATYDARNDYGVPQGDK